MRLFTAITLPDAAREHAQGVQTYLHQPLLRLGRVTWVPPHNVHVTLKFLGEVSDDRVQPLCDALRAVRVEAIRLAAERLVFFPWRGPVRVIAIGLSGDVAQAQILFERVEQACLPWLQRRNVCAFQPHVTLGRARDGVRLAHEAVGDVGRFFPGPVFEARSFTLFKSTLTSRGSIYEPLTEVAA